MVTRFLSKSLFAAAAVAASAFSVSPAVAAVEGLTRSTTVSYADLDLGTHEGRETLNDRLVRASRYVCGSTRGVSLRTHMNILNCREDALSNARRAMVTVIARAETGEQVAAGENASVAVGGR